MNESGTDRIASQADDELLQLAAEIRRDSRRDLLAQAVTMREQGRYPYVDGWYTVEEIERLHAARALRDRPVFMQAVGTITAGWVVFLALAWLFWLMLLPD